MPRPSLHTLRPALRRLRRSQGFTLIELMVALVLSATLVSALYQFFARTSESMYEADSMAGTTDQARFAMEMVSRELQSAGAFASPDTATDPWMNTTQSRRQGVRVRAFLKPLNQQDVRLPNSIHDSNFAKNTHNGDSVISTDSLIVVGAYDFPFSVQIADVKNIGTSGMTVRLPVNGRASMRLLSPDPFNTEVADPNTFSFPTAFQNYFSGDGVARWRGRLLRVIDRQGFIQFAAQSAAPQYDDQNGITLTLGGPKNAFLLERAPNELMGLAPSTNDGTEDVGYDAAFVDAFRYRLCVDQADPTNLKLVRERLDGSAVIGNNPAPAMPPLCGVLNSDIIEQVPVVEHAVDFQVWFDCNSSVDITQEDVTGRWGGSYGDSWRREDTGVSSISQHNCALGENGGTGTSGLAGRARVAHIRLSVRTDNERGDVGNYMFLDNRRLGTLQTVDLDNESSTSARVVTFQTDVELPNANYRTSRAPVVNP